MYFKVAITVAINSIIVSKMTVLPYLYPLSILQTVHNNLGVKLQTLTCYRYSVKKWFNASEKVTVQGPYSQTILKNALCLFRQDLEIGM